MQIFVFGLPSPLILNHKRDKDGVTLSPSDGTLNGVPCQGSQPPWHAKDCLPDVRKRVFSLRASRKS
jgi:hypothetical protein